MGNTSATSCILCDFYLQRICPKIAIALSWAISALWTSALYAAEQPPTISQVIIALTGGERNHFVLRSKPARLGYITQRLDPEATTVTFTYCGGASDEISVSKIKPTGATCAGIENKPDQPLLWTRKIKLPSIPIYVPDVGLVGEFEISGPLEIGKNASSNTLANYSPTAQGLKGTYTAAGNKSPLDLEIRQGLPWYDVVQGSDGEVEFLVRDFKELEKALTLSAQ